MTRRRLALTIASTLALSMLSACGTSEDGKSKELAALDDNLTGKQSDPATRGAIEDQILVDPQLADSANGNAVKAAATVGEGQVPADVGYDGDIASAEELDAAKIIRAPQPVVLKDEDCATCQSAQGETLGARAAAQAASAQRGRGKGTCEAKMQYGAAWANRMPTEFPVYPKARVQEAAGVENGICDIRAVTFTSSAKLQDVVDWYYTRARRSGYTAEYVIKGGEYMLGGTRDNDEGAYVLTLTERKDGGTRVDLIASNGR